MLVDRMTPYTFNAPYGPYPGVWMPPTLGLLFFIGYLPCDISSKVWLITEIAGFIWVIWMIADYKLPSRWVFTVCLFALFLFPAFWIHVSLGQFSMLFVILMMINVYLPQVGSLTPLFLVLELTKPQLAILIYPCFLMNVWRENGFRQVTRLVLSTLFVAALLTVPLFLYYPGWLNDFLVVTLKNLGAGWNLPTLFVQLPVLLGIAGYYVWAFVFLLSLVASLRLWALKGSKFGLIATLAITPMVTPYASSWDFLLLLPAFFWLMIKMKSRTAHVVLLLTIFTVVAIQIAVRWHQDIQDGTQWWIPPVLLLGYLLTLTVEYLTVRNKLIPSQRFVS
ncbi:MAG: hypothetical protein PHQ40_18520 [Anaerolineaceae bacterium]|nr:hypothetical protein [Anaerolineaceae bacterium]